MIDVENLSSKELAKLLEQLNEEISELEEIQIFCFKIQDRLSQKARKKIAKLLQMEGLT